MLVPVLISQIWIKIEFEFELWSWFSSLNRNWNSIILIELNPELGFLVLFMCRTFYLEFSIKKDFRIEGQNWNRRFLTKPENRPTTPTLVQTLPANFFNFLGLHLHRIGFIGWGLLFNLCLIPPNLVKLVNCVCMCVCLCSWCRDWEIWVSRDCCLLSRNTFSLCISPNTLASGLVFSSFSLIMFLCCGCLGVFFFFGFNSFLVCH